MTPIAIECRAVTSNVTHIHTFHFKLSIGAVHKVSMKNLAFFIPPLWALVRTGWWSRFRRFTTILHTRAYVNHLIATKELLAPVLLTMHNTYSYSRCKFQLARGLLMQQFANIFCSSNPLTYWYADFHVNTCYKAENVCTLAVGTHFSLDFMHFPVQKIHFPGSDSHQRQKLWFPSSSGN